MAATFTAAAEIPIRASPTRSSKNRATTPAVSISPGAGLVLVPPHRVAGGEGQVAQAHAIAVAAGGAIGARAVVVADASVVSAAAVAARVGAGSVVAVPMPAAGRG